MSAAIYGVTWTVTIGDLDGFTSRKLRLPGSSGDYASTPDSSDLDITGDIDLRAYVALDDWTSGSVQALVSKFVGSGNQRSYKLAINGSGNIRLDWSPDGTSGNLETRTSTAVVPFSDGAVGWVRATLEVDNGASGHDVQFFTSTDGSTWTQLGSTVTTAGTTSIYSSTAALEIGSINGGTSQLATGDFFEAEGYNGINGTQAIYFESDSGLVGKTTFVQDTPALGDDTNVTWTLNGSAAFVGIDGDFTSFVQGLQVKQGGPIGRVNPGTLNVRIDNSTGLFTPGLGNAYSDVDWFTKLVRVTAQVDAGGGGEQAVSDVFHGVIRQFKLHDSGHSSYVDIVGHDALTVSSRGPQISVFSAGFTSSTPSQVIEGLLSTSFDSQDPGIVFPKLNESAAGIFDLGDTPTTPQLRSSVLPKANARQLIDNHVLPSGPFVLWATDIEHDTGNSRAKYKGCMVGNTLRKTTPDDDAASANGDAGTTGSRYNRRTFEFTDNTSSTTALFFSKVKFDFTNSELANRCTTASTFTGTSAQGVQSLDSINLYGVRSKDFPQTCNETNATALEVSNFWAVRFADVEFTVQQLELGLTNAEAATGGSATQKRMLGDLLDIRSGVWNASNLSISNLRGQSAADTRTVTIIGRTINVTPDRFSITLDVRGSSQYGAFILDESRLDQDRIF